ncbi:MAG TPA: DUF4427 domain-containing protein [Aurantimonas coralicida]|uniref:DUF4427 domain-containing protein n=2 Tax=root TaxID=1 RepID=A0A9C9TIZ5_9HYPH|nr:DUF4427 domain-containing protein [Aurantimonas coralicida]HEU02854.1 DUF4427 domain-containing protein [Aurantimonas coralicida]
MSVSPENWGPHAIVEDVVVTPLFLLRNALRLQRLWATWSVRRGRRTVYGPHPAVCLTDMPIAAFIEAGKKRAAKGEAMSAFSIVLPKDHVHAAGARPAIYGLSVDVILPRGDECGSRILPDAVLPEAEQYRYVTLGDYGKVDWTHEREWRWPCRDEPTDPQDIPPLDGKDVPGLDLTFPGMGVIVRTQEQAHKILHDILVLNDMHSSNSYDFILVADSISDLPALRDPGKVRHVLTAASIDLESIIFVTKTDRILWLAKYNKAVSDVSTEKLPKMGREIGGCWLWLTDAAHPLTRALVAEGVVHINQDGRYLVDVPFDKDLPLSVREELARRLAALLRSRHQQSATYHSVLGKFGWDDIPSYSNPPLENRLIFNYAHDDDDR